MRRANAARVQGAVTTELVEAVDPSAGGDTVRNNPLYEAEAHIGLLTATQDAEARQAVTRAIEWSRRAARAPSVAATKRLKAYERPAREESHGGEPHTDINV